MDKEHVVCIYNGLVLSHKKNEWKSILVRWMNLEPVIQSEGKSNGCEFEETPGDSEGQGSLACWSPWGCKESDTTEQLN